MYLPTTIQGMNSAIGQYIHSLVAANIKVMEALDAAKKAAPGYVEEKFVWDKKFETPLKKTDAEVFQDYCANIRARNKEPRKGAKRNGH